MSRKPPAAEATEDDMGPSTSDNGFVDLKGTFTKEATAKEILYRRRVYAFVLARWFLIVFVHLICFVFQHSVFQPVNSVAYMMYAFGDDDSSLVETVDLMEDETQLLWGISKRRFVLDLRRILCMDMVIDYASGILRKALDVATLRSRSAVKASVNDGDILTVVKQDPKKYDRLLELQRLKEELENTRQIDGTGDTQRELVVTKDQARALGAK